MTATRTVHLNVQRPIQDITQSIGHCLDLPLEWYDALVKGLRAEVCDAYEIPEQRLQRIMGVRAQQVALDEITDWGAQGVRLR